MYLKVEDQKNLVRDTNSNAILNTDKEALRRHRARIASEENKDKIINELSERVKYLEDLILSKLKD